MSFLDQFSGESYKGGEPESAPMISGPEHTTVVDESYGKKRLIRVIIIAAALIILAVTIFIAVRLLNRVTVGDFVGTSIDEVKRWGLTSGITIETQYEYSLAQPENMILTQSAEPNSKLQKGGALALTVSRGADPKERIELPDFSTMTTDQVTAWKDEVKANNVSITQEYSDTVEKEHYIRQKFANSSVNAANYTRQDSLIVYMSRGAEVFEANITVPNLVNRSKDEAEYFAEENELEISYQEKASDTVPMGFIVSQSVPKGTKIAKHSKISFVVSLGKAVTVPDFDNLTMEEAGVYPGLAVTVKTKYSGSLSYGRVISQSEPAGSELTGDMPQVTVIYSLGKPYIDNLIGTSEKELAAYFYDYKAKGADISYTVTYVDSYEPKGQIVDMSAYSEYVSMTDSIRIKVSRGNLDPPTYEPHAEEPPTEDEPAVKVPVPPIIN